MAISKSKMNLNLDLRFISLALLVLVLGMLFMWRPWSTAETATTRTIKVNGEAKVTAEPDEYIFQPTYEFKNANKEVALVALNTKSEEVTKELKKLGVASSKIKANSDGYDYPDFYLDKASGDSTYTLRFTVKTSGKDVTQKVQDYLVSTSPTGQVSPQANFSDSLRKSLESKARDEATRDARKKADQSAQNLGFKVGKVKSIEDNATSGGVMPYMSTLNVGEDSAVSASPRLEVQPGENDLTYNVTVIYFIR